MAGICGVTGPVSENIVRRMAACLGHRGDITETVSGDYGTITMVRRAREAPLFQNDAAVIAADADVYAIGPQSMPDQAATVAYLAANPPFPDHIPELRGSFAIAVVEPSTGKVTMARDIFGTRSLYYYQADGRLYFASEMKCFLAIPGFNPEINTGALFYYLSGGYAPDRDTILTRVYRVMHGETVRASGAEVTRERYWRPVAADPGPEDRDHWAGSFWEALQESTRATMPPEDARIGIMLSGGLDSSLVAATMRKVAPDRKITGFSLDYGNDYELGIAKNLAKSLDIDQKIVKIDYRVFYDDLERLQWIYDEPLIKFTFIPTYHIFDAAKEHVDVLFTGDGGDEIFMGYRNDYWEDPSIISIFSRLGVVRKPILRLGEAVCRPLARNSRWELLSLGTEFFSRSYASDPDWQFRVATRIFEAFLHEEELRRLFPTSQVPEITRETAEAIREAIPTVPIEKLSHTLINGHLQDDLLRLDKSTAVTGVTTRSPLLDPDLLRVSLKIPPGLKYRDHSTKYIFRYMTQKYDLLPDELIYPKIKTGLNAPVTQWLNDPDFIARFNTLIDAAGPLPRMDKRYVRRFFPPRTYVQSLKSWNLSAVLLWSKVVLGSEEC